MTEKLRFVFAAGGTGGHILPAIAVAEILRERDLAEVKFVGVGRELEKLIICGAKFEQYVIPSLPVVGAGVVGAFRALRNLPSNVQCAREFYAQYKPNLVVGFGGFPSFVPVLAAAVSKIPVVIQEQNVKVGLANRIASILAERIYAVPGAHGFFSNCFLSSWFLSNYFLNKKIAGKKQKIFTISNPVRPAFGLISEWQAPKQGEQFTILVVGGSQGARSINNAIMEMSDWLLRHNIKIIHQTGEKQFDEVQKVYSEKGLRSAEVLPFIDNIANYYEKAHLVICRAGAMTVAEVVRSGRPAIFIPLPISGAHQFDNVLDLQRKKLAIVLEQTERLAEDLTANIEALMNDFSHLGNVAKELREYALSAGEDSASFLAKELVAMVSHV